MVACSFINREEMKVLRSVFQLKQLECESLKNVQTRYLIHFFHLSKVPFLMLSKHTCFFQFGSIVLNLLLSVRYE